MYFAYIHKPLTFFFCNNNYLIKLIHSVLMSCQVYTQIFYYIFQLRMKNRIFTWKIKVKFFTVCGNFHQTWNSFPSSCYNCLFTALSTPRLAHFSSVLNMKTRKFCAVYFCYFTLWESHNKHFCFILSTNVLFNTRTQLELYEWLFSFIRCFFQLSLSFNLRIN